MWQSGIFRAAGRLLAVMWFEDAGASTAIRDVQSGAGGILDGAGADGTRHPTLFSASTTIWMINLDAAASPAPQGAYALFHRDLYQGLRERVAGGDPPSDAMALLGTCDMVEKFSLSGCRSSLCARCLGA